MMAIDGCKHSFGTLSRVVLPKHMVRLQSALKSALPASQFIQPGTGIKRIATALGKPGDFRGCYVFLAGRCPFYVGISKKVIERIRQHLRGRSHFEATLAYRMAERRTSIKRSRAENMESRAFMRCFERERRCLARANVAFIEIP